MGKKKPANKRNAATTTPPATNGGTPDENTSPTASTFAKDDQNDSTEPAQDEIKNASNSTEANSTGDAATTTADTPAPPMSKGQKKKAAAARKAAAAAAALANEDTVSQEPTTTDEAGTPAEPDEDSEANTNVTKSDFDEPETSKPLENGPAPEPEKDLEGDAWGLNEDESSKVDRDVTKPTADEASAPGAQDGISADGLQVTAVESKSEDSTPRDTATLNDDKASESVPPLPRGEAPSDAVPNSSNGSPSPDTSDPLETKNDPVIPSGEVSVDEHQPNVGTTKPNGTFNCEPMDLPPRPSDDDNTPLAQFASRKKPTVDTSLVFDGLANGGASKQTPSLAGENLGSARPESNSNTTGTGLFSNSPSRPTAPSTSPSTSGVPARSPGAVGFGSAPTQTPSTTPSFGFGFGSPQKPKTASGMSWSPSPAAAPSKPAPKSGWWSGLANKARETFEQAVNDGPSPAPAPAPAPAPGPRAPPARPPSVERPPQPSPVGPANSNSNPNATTPASPTDRPTKGMTAFEMKMAALRKKASTGANKDSSPVPTAETPKASSSTVPLPDSGASPISPSQSTQSHTQSQPLPLPLPPSTSAPTEQTAPQTPNQAEVTSALSSQPRENTAETGKVGKLIAQFDIPEAPISSKTATTGLRLHTQPAVPDGRRSASPVTKRDSAESETGRPSLADMRSSSAPGPRTPLNTTSPKTPGSFNFGAGLGGNRFGGPRFGFGGGGLPGFRPGHGPSPISTPVAEKNETKPKSQRDDDLSSVVEGSEPTDLDSQVGESEPQDLDSLVDDSGADALANLPIDINIDTPTIPTTFNAPVPDVAPSYANPWDRPPVPAETRPVFNIETTAPLPSPTKSKPEPEVAVPDDKTVADPSDLADVTPESAPKDEPQVESPVTSEPVVTPAAEKPIVPLVVEEPVVAPAMEGPVVAPIVDQAIVAPVVDEPIVKAILNDEAPAPESTELAVTSEPQVDEPPPERPTEEAPEAPVEPVVEPAVEPVTEPTVEAVIESVVEPAIEPAPEPAVEPVVEPTPEPVVESVVEPPEPVAAPTVESVSEPVVEPATVAYTLEPPFSQPLPPSPIEPPVVEEAPVAPVETPSPPKLTVDVPQTDESSKPKSPLPPTPVTPATPATPAKKKNKKKNKKGTTVVSEAPPAIPETISEPAPQSEPASRSEPVSKSEPVPQFVSEPGPEERKVKPILEASAESAAPSSVEPIPEAVESTPVVEVIPATETPKEPEPVPEVVEDTKPKEEAAQSGKSKKSKPKKKRKSSTAPVQAASPTDDLPPTPIEAEQPEAKVVDVAEPDMVEPAVDEPPVIEPVVVEPMEVKPVVIEPVATEPVPAESAAVEPVVAEPVVVEPLDEVAPSLATEEPAKSEDNRTAVPDEGFETPKLSSQELPELAAEPLEAAPQSPLLETPIAPVLEVATTPQVELVPDPIPAPLLTEAQPDAIPTVEAQVEPEPESIAEPAVDPIVDAVEVVIGPSGEDAAENLVESVHESVPDLPSEPIVELVAEPTIVQLTEDTSIEEVPPVAEPVPELEAQPPTKPVLELAASPIAEVPNEQVPIPEVKDANPSPSKSSKKKNKRKGAGKGMIFGPEEQRDTDNETAAVVAEEPVPTPTNDEPVVETVRSDIPVASTVEKDESSQEIAGVLAPTTPKKKKGKKPKATSMVPTPVEEKAPVLPLPLEAPMVVVDVPQMEETEETVATVLPAVELEAPTQWETTPRIEIIELPDDQGADAASTISVAQIPHEAATPIQPTPPAVELVSVEPILEVIPEPETVPVLIDLPQSPVTSAPSVSSPMPTLPSLRPEEPVSGTREASPLPRSATPNTDKHDEALEIPQIPIISAPNPVRPVLEHVVSPDVSAPLSASPVSESASQSSRDIGSFGREASIVPRESRSLSRAGSASSITSIDTDSPSTVESAKMRAAMPPLISVPIPSPVATASPKLDSVVKSFSSQPGSDSKPKATITEEPSPSTVPNDAANDAPPKLDTIAKPSSSRILGISPLRWFGFGGSSSPVAENKPVEVKHVESKPVEVKPVEVEPVEVKPVEAKSVEVKSVEVEPVEVKPAEVKPIEVKPVDPKPVELKLTEAKPVETKPVEVKLVEVHSITTKPAETPVPGPSPSPKVTEDWERQHKLVPIRKAASPASPESPAMEKTAWSRWPYPSTMVTSIPPVKPRVPLARDSVPVPSRSDVQTTPARLGRLPPVSTMPPIIPIVPIAAVSPSTPTRVDPQHPRRVQRTNGVTLPTPVTPVHPQDAAANEEKRERPPKRQSTARVTSPTPNIPDVALQSPRSSEDSLPAYTPQAPDVDRDPKPVPRGILKQRMTPPTTPPEAVTPTTADHATPEVSKLEFTGLRNVPAYDDWSHAPPVRKDILTNTGPPRSRDAQPPSTTATTPPVSRSRATGDSNHRSRSKRSSKELGSAAAKVNRARTPSPLRETKAASKTTALPPKPNLVPVLNDKIIRTKAPKPAKISTTRTTGDAYIQPFTSPILLTSENYGARPPESSVYQYDGISPSESLSPMTRKTIFDILQKQVAPQVFPILARASFDGKKMLYAQRRLNVSSRQEFSVELPEDGQEPRVFIVQLKRIAVITPQIAPTFR